MAGRERRTGIAAAAAIAVCSCGSTSGSPPTATASPPAPPDPCLVGTWKSVAVSGSLTVAGAHVDLTGGAGEVLTISASGRVRSDDSSTAALTGTAPDGTAYRITQTGTATGTVIGAPGKLTIELDSPSTVTVTLYRNGVQVQSQHPGAANDSFLCTARIALILTSVGGTVVRYAPG